MKITRGGGFENIQLDSVYSIDGLGLARGYVYSAIIIELGSLRMCLQQVIKAISLRRQRKTSGNGLYGLTFNQIFGKDVKLKVKQKIFWDHLA